jgi:hypothetical protein
LDACPGVLLSSFSFRRLHAAESSFSVALPK